MKVNDPCPCGSGKKYKRCCKDKPQPESLSPNQLKVVPLSKVPPELLKSLQEKKVIEEQRIAQQGYGRPIISAEVNGRRLIAIGSEIFDSGNCKTFHEVLPVYLRVLLGEEWIKSELKKKLEDRHPLLQWHDAMITYQRETIQTQEVQTVPATGAISALLGLAYNLYLMAHNAELQEKLIYRLKNPDGFLGAQYETQVAAFCIQAGFEIGLEDEDDPSSTHCEFTATHARSGRKFSIEAKARMPGKEHGKINKQLSKALKKFAAHERIVFIDVNMPEITIDVESTKWISEAIRDLRKSEKILKIQGKDAPPAYIFLTNHQNAYNLNSTSFDIGAVAESFKIPDYQIDAPFTDLRSAINSRDRHKEVTDIFEAIKRHHKIPSTFDGEIPEFAFGENDENMPRLIIGNKYIVPDGNGKETIGTLLDPVVGEEKGKHVVHAIYELEDKRKVIIRNELTEKEVAAYKQHPDTFFGIYKEQSRTANTPIEFYDFAYESYSKSTKENLLKFMKTYPNYDELVQMSQEELAKLYCEGLTYHAMKSGHFKKSD